jgi:hypothetical protein
MIHASEKVVSRDGKHIGFTSGSTHRCQLESCRGLRVSVKWDDGTRTYPCTKGMVRENGVWRIL